VLITIFKRKIAKFLISTIFYGVNLKSIFLTLIKVRILKAHLSYEVFGSESLSEKKQFLILALFPRKALLPSIIRFVDFNISIGFHPIIVLNHSRDSDLFHHSLQRFGDEVTILMRNNIGRDFGAYQCAMSYLNKKVDLTKPEKIAFFNDSIFYGKEFDWFTKLNEMNSNVGALYSNFERKPHFGSMAFICDQNVINSNFFKSFWSKYYPTDIRKNVIKNGELKFSTLCIKSGFTFSDLATTLLSQEIKPLNEIEKQAIIMYGVDLQPQKNLLMRVMTVPEFPINQEIYISEKINYQLINLVVTSKNVSHALGIYFARNYHFPFKLDLVKRGAAGILDIQKILRLLNIGDDESQELIFMIGTGGTFYSPTGWNKLFRDFSLKE
jgi:hypothetical protein